MKLINCPECGELVDIDHVEVLEQNDIVGAGEFTFEEIPEIPEGL